MHEEYIRKVDGSKKAVLMIHGIAGSPDHFGGFLPLIPDHWSIYSLLLPGHGGTVRDFGKSNMAAWREYAAQRLAELCQDHDTVCIVAHSMGTLFAIRGALTHPGKVRSLLLMNCPLRAKYPPSTMWLCLRNALGFQDPAAVAMRQATSIRLTPWLWQYIPWAPRFWELLGEIRQVRPLVTDLQTATVSFLSQKDELVRLSTGEILKKNPWVRSFTLENSGHYAYSPEDMAQMQKVFAQQLTDAEIPV